VIATILVAALALARMPGDARMGGLIPVAMAVSLIVAPYVQVYDELLLVPLLAISVARAQLLGNTARRIVTTCACCAFFFGGWLSLWDGPAKQFAVFVPLVLIAALAASGTGSRIVRAADLQSGPSPQRA